MSALATTPVTPSATVSAAAAVTRVGRNTAYRVAAQAASALINVVGMVLLGNALSASGYGDYVFWYALMPLAASVSDLGAGVIVTREIARRPADAARILGDGLLLRLVVGVTMLLAVLFVAGPVLGPARTGLALLVTAAALFDFGQDAAVWAARARERLDHEAVLLLVSQTAWLAGIALGVWLHAPLAFLLATAAVAFVLRTLVGAVWVVRSGIRPSFAPSLARLRVLAREGWPVGLSLLLVVLYGRVGVFALKALASAADVACFNVAYMLSQPLGFMASALAMAAFPAFARLGAGDGEVMRKALRAAQKYQLLLSLPLAAGLSLLSARIVPLFFHGGAGYERAAAGLGLVALGLPFVFLNLQSRYLLAAVGKQHAYLWAVAAGLLVNVAGCVLTARSFGVTGAAGAFVAAEFTVFLVCRHAQSAHVSVADLLRAAGRPLLATLLMTVAVYFSRAAILPLAVLVGMLTYVAALYATRALSRDEWEVVRRVIVSFRLPGARRLAGESGPA